MDVYVQSLLDKNRERKDEDRLYSYLYDYFNEVDESDYKINNLYNDTTLLISAVRDGDKDIVENLIKKQEIDINAKDKEGNTALMVACEIEKKKWLNYY